MGRKVTKKVIRKMISLKKKERLSNKEIGKRVGCCQRTVGVYLRENFDDYEKYKLTDENHPNSPNKEEIKRMCALKENRWSNEEISKKVGYSLITVGKYLKAYLEDYEKYKFKTRKIENNKKDKKEKKESKKIKIICPFGHQTIIEKEAYFRIENKTYIPCKECSCSHLESKCKIKTK